MERWIAAFLQAGAAVLLVTAGAGAHADDMYLVVFGLPGLAAGVSGLLLWGRGTVATPPLAEPPSLETRLSRMEEVLAGIQADAAHLREDREFLTDLYSVRSAPPRALREPGGG